MITLDVNEGFRWGLGCNLTEAYWGAVVKRREGSVIGVSECLLCFSSQIDHVATSEFPCQSALNINDSARKRTHTSEAGANLDPVLVATLTNPPHLYLSSQNLIGGSRRILTAGAIWRAPFWDIGRLVRESLAVAKTGRWHFQLNV